ncbi:hypothetical protein FOZ61_001284, partial [Perkinsus olseni]
VGRSGVPQVDSPRTIVPGTAEAIEGQQRSQFLASVTAQFDESAKLVAIVA